jgi:hypothetical protein
MRAKQNAERDARGIEHIKCLRREHHNVVNFEDTITKAVLPRLNAIPNAQVTYAELSDCFLAAAEAGEVTFRGTDGKFRSSQNCSAAEWQELVSPPKPFTAAEKEAKRIDSLSAAEYAKEFPPEQETSPRDVATIRQIMRFALDSHPEVILSGAEGRSNIRKFQRWFDGKDVNFEAARDCLRQLLAANELMIDRALLPVRGQVTQHTIGSGHPEPTAVIALVNDGTEKDALRAEIRRMDADEFRERLSKDGVFADAVNNL